MAKMKNKKVINKDEDSENWCFVCKDGGDLRICDHKQCLKSFHPDCVGKEDSFLESEEHWTCAWHICFNCDRSSQSHCYTCTKAVCRYCLPKPGFLQVKGKYGFCDFCLKLALMIEENKDYDSDGEKVDFMDRETREGLFMEYYMIIKAEEGFEPQDIYTAQDRSKKKKKGHKFGSCSEEFDDDDDDEDEEQVSDYDNEACDKKHKRRCKEKKCEKTPKKSNQVEFVGWASKSLLEFLNSIGKNNNEQLSQDDVAKIVHEYVKENKLIHPEKKKTIVCDERLRKLFRRKTIGKFRVPNQLEAHFTENRDESEDDEVDYDSENDNVGFQSDRKKQRKLDVEKKMEKNEVEFDLAKCGFAAIVDENVKLVYLKRSVLYELLNEPQSFEKKVTGCFVRAKSDPYDCYAKTSFQLKQVKGVKAVSIGEKNVETVLLFSTMPKEIGISLLSDCDFSKEECEDLREKVLSGELERPTVGELQKKAKVVHKDITKHRIIKELDLLKNKMDQANEKGWRREYFEYLEKRRTLQSPLEQSRLLESVPKVIPDISELHSNSGDVKDDMKSDEDSPTSVLHCDNVVPGASEEKKGHLPGHASPLEKIPCKKGQADDENANDSKVTTPILSNKTKLDNDLENEKWWILGPYGEKDKCSLSVMKIWNERSRYASKFKAWKEGQSEEEAIPLPTAINIAFPKR